MNSKAPKGVPIDDCTEMQALECVTARELGKLLWAEAQQTEFSS